MFDKEKFCKNLQQLRADRKETQEVMADALSIQRGTIARWESGSREPNLHYLCQLSEYFDITLDELIKGK